MKCSICVSVKKEHPELTNKQLFPRGLLEEAVVFHKGTGYCINHFNSVNAPSKN